MEYETKPLDPSPDGMACSRYQSQLGNRMPYLQRGWDCAELTIPSLLPRMGTSSASPLPTPWQAVGARGLNNLSSRLLMTALPTNQPFFKQEMDVVEVKKLLATADGKNQKTLLDSGLSAYEQAVMSEIKKSGDRVSVFEAFKHLLAVGNVLLHDSKQALRVYHLDHYVVRRDPSGNALEIIAFEQVDRAVIPHALHEAVEKHLPGNHDTPVDLYTRVLRGDTQWHIYQEMCGQIVPGTEGTYPLDECPWIPLRFAKIDGENYGRGYVEEYLGDFRTCEDLSQALAEGAKAAAKFILMVKPNGTTRIKSLQDAKNGDIISGNDEEVTALQSLKAQDFTTAEKRLEVIEHRLEQAFLLNSSVQRSGERVTAEEIRFMAQELETILGGFYTILSVEFQLPYVKSKIAKMRKRGSLPPLPKGLVTPTIVTGMDAMGRSMDGQTLKDFMQDVATTFGPDNAALYINVSEGITRLATARGIDTEGLVNSQEDVQAKQQQQQLQDMAHKLGPQAISAGGKIMQEGMKNGQVGATGAGQASGGTR